MARPLAHRLRVLLHTAPLHALSASDGRVAAEMRHYDTLELAVTVLDLVVDTMGLENEIDRDGLVLALNPLLTQMDRAHNVVADPVRHAAVVDRVVGALRNDADRRRPFVYEYGDFDGNAWVKRRLEFRLLSDYFHPSGRTVLRLSTEAVNLYLNALELDIEDAQAATEAVVQSQIARGKITEAVESARQARWQSLRYQEKIGRTLRQTRRDVATVDWREAVPAMLTEALAHVTTRLEVEDGILKAAGDRLDVLPSDATDGEPNDSRLRLVEIIDIVRDCERRHTQLHRELMTARAVFLDEQARQRFVPPAARFLPDLPSDVLAPMLEMGSRSALLIIEEAFSAFVGPHAPGQLSLTALIDWQLHPRRAEGTGGVDVIEPDLARIDEELARFPPAVRDAAEQWVHGVVGRTTLSELMGTARQGGASAAVLEALALIALRMFAPDADRPPVRVDLRAGERLMVDGFFGDELELVPLIDPGVDGADVRTE